LEIGNLTWENCIIIENSHKMSELDQEDQNGPEWSQHDQSGAKGPKRS